VRKEKDNIVSRGSSELNYLRLASGGIFLIFGLNNLNKFTKTENLGSMED